MRSITWICHAGQCNLLSKCSGLWATVAYNTRGVVVLSLGLASRQVVIEKSHKLPSIAGTFWGKEQYFPFLKMQCTKTLLRM